MSATLDDTAALEGAALDAYSRLVVEVADASSPSVASLRVQADRGGGRMRSAAAAPSSSAMTACS